MEKKNKTSEEKKSWKRIEAALRNPYKVAYLSEAEAERYCNIKNAMYIDIEN